MNPRPYSRYSRPALLSAIDPIEIDRLGRRVYGLGGPEAAAIAAELWALPQPDKRLRPWRRRVRYWWHESVLTDKARARRWARHKRRLGL